LMLTGDMTAGGTDVAAGAEVAAGADCCWTEAGVPHPTAASHALVITTRAMLNDSRVMVALSREPSCVAAKRLRNIATSSHVGAERSVQ
jgi:hypothetical protein